MKDSIRLFGLLMNAVAAALFIKPRPLLPRNPPLNNLLFLS